MDNSIINVEKKEKKMLKIHVYNRICLVVDLDSLQTQREKPHDKSIHKRYKYNNKIKYFTFADQNTSIWTWKTRREKTLFLAKENLSIN